MSYKELSDTLFSPATSISPTLAVRLLNDAKKKVAFGYLQSHYIGLKVNYEFTYFSSYMVKRVANKMREGKHPDTLRSSGERIT